MVKHDAFLELAKDVSTSAGDLLMRKFGKIEKIGYKSEKDLVTEADLEAEKLIISRIKEKHPDHSFLAEESGESTGGSDFTWVIDPLDGTINFAYGIPLFGVSVALLKGKEPVLGVINIPSSKRLFHARKGSGTFVNGKRVHVSRRKKLSEMLLLYDTGTGSSKNEIMSTLDAVIGQILRVRMLGAATIDFENIILGSADLWLAPSTKPWDIAAGCLLVEEAGGKVTDFEGNPWTPWSENLVVSNGLVHEQTLGIIRSKNSLQIKDPKSKR